MDLPESKISYWKDRFIDGLPPLFVERVKKTLRGDHTEIPYDTLTCGKLIGTCTQEGLNLCNELKLAQQIKRNQMSERSQLGDFCAQFGIEGPFNPNQKIFSFEEDQKRKYKKHHRSKRYKEKKEAKKASRKATRFARNFSKRDLKNIKCYKCGKFGHLASNCKAENLKALELDDSTEEKVYELLYESNSGSSRYSSDFSNSDNDKSDATNKCVNCTGDTCVCGQDEFYKIQSQIEESNLDKLQSQFTDFNLHMISSNNVIELLKDESDENLRNKILEMTSSQTSSSKSFEKPKKE